MSLILTRVATHEVLESQQARDHVAPTVPKPKMIPRISKLRARQEKNAILLYQSRGKIVDVAGSQGREADAPRLGTHPRELMLVPGKESLERRQVLHDDRMRSIQHLRSRAKRDERKDLTRS